MTPVKPQILKPRDLVALVAPSGNPDYPDMVQQGVRFLEGLGLKVKVGESVSKDHAYIGRDRRLRADDINRQFADRRVKGIFCLVGGFSAFEILEMLDFAKIAKNPKIFMGFSDNTSLLNAVQRKTGLVTFMGENVLWGLSEGREKSREHFARALMDPRPLDPAGCEVEMWRGGDARGVTLAGNLWTLVWLQGTEWAPRWRGRIFFWEDVGENVDDVNSALWHLRLTGAFAGLKGMVVGHLEGIEEQKFGITVRKVSLRVSEGESWPVAKVESFGHHVSSMVIPIGVKARLWKGALRFEESGVIS